MSTGLVVDTDSFGEDSPVLACPVCEYEYVHVESVSMLPSHSSNGRGITVMWNGREDEASALSFEKTLEPGDGRRVSVVLHGYCEDGHAFDILLIQHKGITQIEWKHTGTRFL